MPFWPATSAAPQDPATSPAYWTLEAAAGAAGATGCTRNDRCSGSDRSDRCCRDERNERQQWSNRSKRSHRAARNRWCERHERSQRSDGSDGPGLQLHGSYNAATSYNPYDVVTENVRAMMPFWPALRRPRKIQHESSLLDAGSSSWRRGCDRCTRNDRCSGPTGATGVCRDERNNAAMEQPEQRSNRSHGPQGIGGANGTNGANGATGSDGPGLQLHGSYNAATSYNPYDVVTENGSSYDAILASTSAAPQDPATSPAYWTLEAAAGAAGATCTRNRRQHRCDGSRVRPERQVLPNERNDGSMEQPEQRSNRSHRAARNRWCERHERSQRSAGATGQGFNSRVPTMLRLLTIPTM